MQVKIKNDLVTASKLTRDGVPTSIVGNILGKTLTLVPVIDGNGFGVQAELNGKLGLWSIASDCYELA